MVDEFDKKSQRSARRLFDLPPSMALVIFIANAVFFSIGVSAYAALGFDRPYLAETITLAIIDIAILIARWRLPKTWTAISGEKLS